MYTGWRANSRFKVNRPLTQKEKGDKLEYDAMGDGAFDDHTGSVALNSTYLEWIDRRFNARGSFGTGFSVLMSGGFLAFSLWWWWFGFNQAVLDTPSLAVTFLGEIGGLLATWFFAWQMPMRDFFQKTYYPIRFNRKSGMIYVYRDKRDGGILEMPWGSVYFHIGYGTLNPTLCDIRGEIIEKGIVKDTFALGLFTTSTRSVREMWAFICRYMDGGPEAVGPDPWDRYIELSLHGSWRDCVVISQLVYTRGFEVLTPLVTVPMYLFASATRWFVFRTCTMPVWPPQIEAACAIAPDDPYIWKQPAYMDQFSLEIPQVRERRSHRREANRAATSLPPGQQATLDAIGAWEAEVREARAKTEQKTL